MRVTGVHTNLSAADIAARFTSPDGRASVQLVTGDATSPQDSVMSVHVGDGVDAAYDEALRRGYEIVHPLTDEPWGVRRFLVRAPDGNVINMVNHRDDVRVADDGDVAAEVE